MKANNTYFKTPMESNGNNPGVRGHLRADWTVWCGLCWNFEELDTPTEGTPMQSAHKRGWRRKKQVGWLCPGCQRKNTA